MQMQLSDSIHAEISEIKMKLLPRRNQAAERNWLNYLSAEKYYEKAQ